MLSANTPTVILTLALAVLHTTNAQMGQTTTVSAPAYVDSTFYTNNPVRDSSEPTFTKIALCQELHSGSSASSVPDYRQAASRKACLCRPYCQVQQCLIWQIHLALAEFFAHWALCLLACTGSNKAKCHGKSLGASLYMLVFTGTCTRSLPQWRQHCHAER